VEVLGYTHNVDTLVSGNTNLCGLSPEINTNDTHGRGFVKEYEAREESVELWLGRFLHWLG
jgi:hypothetical protein